MNTQTIGFWIGVVLKVLLILFFIFDAIAKIINAKPAVEATVKLGVAPQAIPTIGILLLVFTVVYAIPATANLGVVLLTAYLGAATAVMVVANLPGHPYFFPVVMGIVTWVAQALVSSGVRAFILGQE